MSNARNLARLLPNSSGLLPNTNIEAVAANKLTGSVSTANGGNKILKITQVYQSSSRVVFSDSPTYLQGEFNYPISARIGGTFTKLSSTSYLVVIAHISVGAMTNTHDLYMWDVGSSDYRHLGFDPYRADNNRICCTFSQTFTGLSAGSRTIYMAAGAGDTRSWTGVLNFNPEADGGNGDTTNAPTTSQMTVMEIEP